MHHYTLTLAILLHSTGVCGYVAQRPLGSHDVAAHTSKGLTFHETSVYRPTKDIIESTAGPEDVASLEFHLYDNFGKDAPFAGLSTFAHLNWTNCFVPEANGQFDIGIVGMPFDLGVSYRPGQRFGPAATRAVSQRMGPMMGYR